MAIGFLRLCVKGLTRKGTGKNGTTQRRESIQRNSEDPLQLQGIAVLQILRLPSDITSEAEILI